MFTVFSHNSLVFFFTLPKILFGSPGDLTIKQAETPINCKRDQSRVALNAAL
jgi:hypothetical protein